MDPTETSLDDNHTVNRFKYQSYAQNLKSVHLPSSFNQSQYERDIGENESHFHEALEHWKQLNLSSGFIKFASHVEPLSLSMPLLLHHWKDIVGSWEEAMDTVDNEGLRALLDLMQKMSHDLRTTLSPVYPAILKRLLKLLPRPLEPAALTVLLETLSSIFRYLLVPSIHMDLLTQSWNAVRLILPKCLPEIQRAFAEVWASVLRRLKSTSRDHAVTLLAESAEGLEELSAWSIVYASKSISQTLHTSTVPIFTSLLAFHISTEHPEPTCTILRRSLTALVHHVRTSEQFLVLGDVMIRELSKVVNSTDTAKPEKLRRLLEIISIPYSARQGSRMSQAHHTSLFALLNAIPLDRDMQPALLRFSSALFLASDASLWLGPGLKFLQQAWDTAPDSNTLEFAMKLHGILADLGWGGWKLVALPILIKATRKLDSLDVDPRLALEVLASLHRAKKLQIEDVDFVWKENTEKWLLHRLLHWSKNDGNIAAVELDNILTLSPFMGEKLTSILIEMINRELRSDEIGRDVHEIILGESTWVLSICLRILQTRAQAEWSTKVDMRDWIMNGVRNWGSVPEVLAGLAALARTTSGTTKSIPLDEIYPNLQVALLSHSRPLRLNTLRLLDTKLVSALDGIHEVLRRCLQGEEVPLDVQGVRERVLRIGRVGQVVGDPRAADFCARWLIAQLKVNLRPLWSPAAAALASLSHRFGDVVWNLVFAEIQGCINGDRNVRQHWHEQDQTYESGDDIWEEERSWRDPSAHKFRVTFAQWLDSEHRVKVLLKESLSMDRFDPISYEHQLLMTLAECHALAERHNRDIVTHFLSLVSEDMSSKLPKQKLSGWLTLFSKFTNPKALYASDTLRAFHTLHLSHPDRNIQTLALSCLFTYKTPQLVNHEERIRVLLDDTRWRDELTLLEMGNIDSGDRGDVVDVIMRLLFGLMLERKGRARGSDRRAAVLTALAGCTDDELGLLVDLMLKPFNSHKHARRGPFSINAIPSVVTDKHLVGYLALLGDVLKNLGSRLVSYWPSLLGSTIDIIHHAQKRSDAVPQGDGSDENEEEQDAPDDVEDKEEMTSVAGSAKVARSIRQLGLKRLADFFRCPVSFDFAPYLSSAFESFILPRLPTLDKENTQAPSALMELFHVWSSRSEYVVFLVQYSSDLLPKIYDCLVATNVKPSVILRVFDITEHILAHSSIDEHVRNTVLKPHVSRLLDNLAVLVERARDIMAITTPIGQRQLNLLSQIAQYSEDPAQATTLLGLFNPLLRKSSKFVSEKIKVDLLKILANLMGLVPGLRDKQSAIYQKTYELLSQLFQSLRSRASRTSLVSAFDQLAEFSGTQSLASLLEDLNAYSTKRIDEPDFDRRLGAFARLNETAYQTLSPMDWVPILHNSLYFIQDAAELAVRSNASLSMRNFVEIVASRSSDAFERLFLRLLFPGLKHGLRSKSELVRAEVLAVIAFAVTKCDFILILKEMRVLLEGGDEEANFFNNILHVQLHRRSRALRRLADHCDEGHLRSSTLADILVPLISNYIASTTTTDHHLVNDAIIATGRMAKHLNWSAYFQLVQRYLKLSKTKDESERIYIRALVAILENFHFPMDETVIEDREGDEEAGSDIEDQQNRGEHAPVVATPSAQLSHIADVVNLRLLPSLLDYLEKHDSTTNDSTRIPVSIGIATVAKHLPESTRELQITRLLTILSQILRSKSQETRDLAREAIVRISTSLGLKYLPLVFKELRVALTRGPQLHVLAFVTHALLVQVTSQEHAEAFGHLDDCVYDVAQVSTEVIFGESGKDVLSEDFKTKMREVRGSSSRGLDSFAIIAKSISPNKISSLLAPLRDIMQQTESLKVMQLVDEVLKRIASGLNSNHHLVPTELIVLCHTLITRNAKFLKQSAPQRKSTPKSDVIVQTKRGVSMDTNHYASNSFRFVSFGLDLFHTALRRNRFDFHNPDVIKRLEPMVIAIGNTLYSTDAPVLIFALKCAAGLTKCPLRNLPKSVPVFITQMIDIIRQTGNTESEIVQIAFKSLATILRDFPEAQIKEKDLIFLLELLSPDLEEHERQAAVFTMLRAIVARKFVVPEIYDIMDKVAEILVTSQSSQVQELCRGVLLQFFLDYPQGKGRLRNQMAFLVKNLSYVYESGRKSVMELLSAIISKFQEGLIHEYTDLLFVGLVMVIANDDSPSCREMAAQLIKSLYARLDEERRRLIFSHLHSWAAQDAQPQLVWVSSQIYGFIIDAAQQNVRTALPAILDDLCAALVRSSSTLSKETDDGENSMEVDVEWKIPYHSLTVLFKALRVFPDLCTGDTKIAWNHITRNLLYPHAWVRIAACRLLGVLYAALPVAPPITDVASDHPASSVGMQEVAAKLCLQLKSENLDEALALQVVKNLFFVGKCFYATPKPSDSRNIESATDLLDDDAEDRNPEEEDAQAHDPLSWLFSKLSYQIKSAHIARRNRTRSNSTWHQQPLAALRWFAAMASHMDADRVEKFLVHILIPVYRLTEDDTIRDAQMEELKTTALELQDMVQAKVGTTKFSAVYNQIRQKTTELRQNRKVAKALQATTNPAAAAKRKLQRNAVKKENRKRKDRNFAESRGKIKKQKSE